MAKFYDPTDVSVNVAGFDIEGYGEDTFISVVRNADLNTASVGADGNVTYNRSADKTGIIEITIKDNSGSNHILKGLTAAGIQFPVIVVDSNASGDLGASAIDCVVQKQPDFVRGAQVGETTWALIASDVDVVFSALSDVAEAAIDSALAALL